MTAPSLHLAGNLSFTVEGPGGASAGRVQAAGSQIMVYASEPVAALNGALSAAAGGAFADALAHAGLTIDVVGPRGTVFTAVRASGRGSAHS